MPQERPSQKRGWRKVQVDDEFLLGLSEPGFQELECINASDVTLVNDDLKALIAKADAQLAAEGKLADPSSKSDAKKSNKKKKMKKQQSKRQSNIPDPATHLVVATGDASADSDLLTKLARLEAENWELRSAAKGSKIKKTNSEPARKKSKVAAADDEIDGDFASEQSSPSLDMSAWDDYGLDELVVASLARVGFSAPTPIQHECLPAAIVGNADIIGAAQTGSGKTLAFGLPILNYLVKEARELADLTAEDPSDADSDEDQSSRSLRLRGARDRLRALIVCPTRELAMQVSQHLNAISESVGIRVIALVGGISPQKQARLLRYKPPVIVATPGRLWDCMRNGALHVSDLTHLSFLVLDEADRMVKQGHYEELSHILDQIPLEAAVAGKAPAAPVDSAEPGDTVTVEKAARCTTLHTYVFSATLTLPVALKSKLQRGRGGSRGTDAGATFESLMNGLRFRGKPKVADLTSERKIADGIAEAYVSCSEQERDHFLYYILAQHPGRTLVFMNAISGVRRVSALLKILGLPAMALHAQQQQRQRLKALDRFKGDPNGILVATDVAARGLDIRDVATVLQYQLPATADTFIHRAGRTARGEGAVGINVSFVVPAEAPRFAALHRALGRDAPPLFPVEYSVLPKAAERWRLAARIDELERHARRDQAEDVWLARQADELGIELDEDTVGHKRESKQRGVSDSVLVKRLRAELEALLASPLQKRINASFFTGGMSQLVATALKASGTASADAFAESGNGDNIGSVAEPHVAPSAMQQSLVLAQQAVDSRSNAAAGVFEAKGKGNAQKRVQKPRSLAASQAAALQKAVRAKRASKAGRTKHASGAVVAGRDKYGLNALAALQSSS